MKPWTVLGRTRTPDGTELTLTQHTSEYVILANGQCLMSSRTHGSEGVQRERVRRRLSGGGSRHTILVAHEGPSTMKEG